MMLVGILMCLCLGTMAQESPVSPWQSLNQAMSDPPKSEQPEAAQKEYNDTPYEVTYPEVNYKNGTEDQYLSDEELILQSLPFKVPFKMDKKQLALTMKLVKAAVKPILKSKELHDFVAYIENNLKSYRADLETQMYVTLLLDSMQEIYEGKETSELNMMVKRFVTDMSDEQTARTLGNVFSDYLGPAVHDYFLSPMRSYFIQPVRNYFYDPLSDYVYNFAERVETWMGSSQRPYIDVHYPENYYNRWSERVNDYANRISDWASQARQGLEMARRMLELQDEARCHGCSPDDEVDHQFFDVYNVKVHDMAWLAWLSAIALIALIAPAIAIPLGVGIPLGLAGGPTGPPPSPEFVAVQVPVISVPPPPPPIAGTAIAGTGPFATAPAFGTGPAPAFGTGPAPAFGTGADAFSVGAAPGELAASDSYAIRRHQSYSPYEHIERKAEAFDYSVLNDSNMKLKFSDKDAYNQYTRYGEKDE